MFDGLFNWGELEVFEIFLNVFYNDLLKWEGEVRFEIFFNGLFN